MRMLRTVPGRNITSIIEVAARNQLLKIRGHHSAKEFREKLDEELARQTQGGDGGGGGALE